MTDYNATRELIFPEESLELAVLVAAWDVAVGLPKGGT